MEEKAGNYNMKIMNLGDAQMAYEACIDVSLFEIALGSFKVPVNFHNYLNDFMSCNFSNTLEIPDKSIYLSQFVDEVDKSTNEAINGYYENKETILTNVYDRRVEELTTVYNNIQLRLHELYDLICTYKKERDDHYMIIDSLVCQINESDEDNDTGRYMEIEERYKAIDRCNTLIKRYALEHENLYKFAENTIRPEIHRGGHSSSN